MNAVVHAYPHSNPGTVEVSADQYGEGIEVAVRDHGSGFRPRPADPADRGLRLGLPLIATLSDRFEIHGGSSGTEVRMVITSPRNGGTPRSDDDADLEGMDGASLSIPAGTFVRPVLARVIGALAARADLAVDRLSDTILLGDAISAHTAADFEDDTVGIAILPADGRLDVRVGPLVEGGGERLLDELELPGGTALGKLATEISVRQEPGDAGESPVEYLVIGIEG